MALTRKIVPWSSKLLEAESAETPEVGYVSLAELHVDLLHWVEGQAVGYQHPLDDPRVEQYVAEFDIRRVRPLICNRRIDGSLWILDGSHTAEVLRRVGKQVALALVYNGLTRAQEANEFYHLNTDRKSPNTWTKFGSRYSGGDHVVQALVALAAEFGFRIGTPDRALQSIAAVKALEDIYKYPNGPHLLREVLGRIKEFWASDVLARDGVFLHGLASFIYTWDGGYYQSPGEKIDWRRFATVFVKVSAADIQMAAKALHREAGLQMGASTYAIGLRDIYNGKANFTRRLEGKIAVPSTSKTGSKSNKRIDYKRSR